MALLTLQIKTQPARASKCLATKARIDNQNIDLPYLFLLFPVSKQQDIKNETKYQNKVIGSYISTSMFKINSYSLVKFIKSYLKFLSAVGDLFIPKSIQF